MRSQVSRLVNFHPDANVLTKRERISVRRVHHDKIVEKCSFTLGNRHEIAPVAADSRDSYMVRLDPFAERNPTFDPLAVRVLHPDGVAVFVEQLDGRDVGFCRW